MATVRQPGPTAGLAILDAAPDGLLDCSARDLHRVLGGPTLIELDGERDPALFVSILQHGNEDSGLGAIQRVLARYRHRRLPRSLMLFVGNVEAARNGLRRLDGQPDYNRVWPGTTHDRDTAECRTMADVHARVLARRALAAIDFHNNSGRNPHYSVVCTLDRATLGLAAMFTSRAVCFRGIPGTQTASFNGLIPAVTAECGLPGEEANAEGAARFLAAALALDELPDRPRSPLDLYHTLGVVRLIDSVRFGFGGGDTDLRLDSGLDRKNFQYLEAGTILGATNHPMPLQMIDENGRDVAADYFETSGGELRLSRPAVPAMLTSDPRIIRQDCLGYLMESLPKSVI